ncbi:MAG: tetratricopeptide repeat protein [bacterium]|nr:tetratricopeptide repeat protein [bacterium]
MSKAWVAAFGLLMLLAACGGSGPVGSGDGFVGSASCRSCHEDFYKLWAPSFHGLAMQPYTAEFAKANLTPHTEEIFVGKTAYRAEVTGDEGWVTERTADGSEKRLEIVHVLGGKNVYYFLTPWKRGRLQTLPVSYDVNRKAWYDTAASGVRHFPDPDMTDEPLHWTERPYTFNTSCYGCHVSQLTTNYRLDSDSYHTVWVEPGINCETCHGPAVDHVRVCEEAPEGSPPADLQIIKTSEFDVEQTNTMCAPCHAKMVSLSTDFRPGERYFDHYDLVTLEHPDFYPDGRDLGENYTYTSWLMSPCAKSGQLDCLHCHTSSGRYRFKEENPNGACLPCHQDKVDNATAHTRHAADSAASECIACHMPMTEFARMLRSDHSMRPPTPATTAKYKSPNACNLCHDDQDARWADGWVRRWRKRDYQKPVLDRAALVDAARKNDWRRLDDMLAYLGREDTDEVFATSLIRLLRNADDERIWPPIEAALKDSSPLVRAAAADALGSHLNPHSLRALVRAARDDYRLVRIRAAASLARAPRDMLDARSHGVVNKAMAEFERSMRTRPDDVASHTNLGNFYMNRGDMERSLASFETAIEIQPDNVPTLVNVALAYNLAGQNDKAEASLRQALTHDAGNAAANFNLGLLLGELGRLTEARQALRAAVKSDPQMAAAAYNLCVLEAQEDPRRAIRWCRQAAETRPQEPRYAYTLAFYQIQLGDSGAATRVLEDLLARHPDYSDARALLHRIRWPR